MRTLHVAPAAVSSPTFHKFVPVTLGNWHARLCADAPVLYYFGLSQLVGAVLLLVGMGLSDATVMGFSAFAKPAKFFLSTWLLSWAFGTYLPHLGQPRLHRFYAWLTVVVLGGENGYILVQALRGVRSHFNTSDAWGPLIFAVMGIVISVYTLVTLWVGVWFWRKPLPRLTPAVRAGIRWGILLFVVFAFEGGLIGASGGHVVGGAEDAAGVPFLGWSWDHGDLRIAHFVGMHALQVLPLLGAFVLRRAWMVHLAAVGYGLLAAGVLVWALMGRGVLG